MENISYVALSGQLNLKRQLDLVANNLANVNTDGFQADRMRFKEIVLRPARTDDITFNATANIGRDLTPGPVLRTGNPLHFALPDRGYFVVETERGLRYTRSGEFVVDQDNRLVTLDGDPVLDENLDEITVPENATALIASQDGILSAQTVVNGATNTEVLTTIAVVDFADTHRLNKEGSRLLQTEQQAEPLANPIIKQGYIEQSNVVAIKELVAMIELNRRYAQVNKVIEKEDERTGKATQALTQIR